MSYINDRGPVLVFIHVPKTGGTTIVNYISTLFSKTCQKSIQITNDIELEQFTKRPLHEKNQFDFIRWHIPSDIHRLRHHLSRPYLCFTFLRDPLTRMISEYNQIMKNTSSHPAHKEYVDKKIRLEMHLTQRNEGGPKPNRQLRWLAHTDIHCRPWLTPTSELLDQVKLKLSDSFLFVGLTEKMLNSIFLLSHKIRHPAKPYISKNISLNTLPNISQVPLDVIAHFEEHNQADIELYNYAKQLFEQQWEQLSVLKKYSAYRYQLVQGVYEKWRALYTTPR